MRAQARWARSSCAKWNGGCAAASERIRAELATRGSNLDKTGDAPCRVYLNLVYRLYRNGLHAHVACRAASLAFPVRDVTARRRLHVPAAHVGGSIRKNVRITCRIRMSSFDVL